MREQWRGETYSPGESGQRLARVLAGPPLEEDASGTATPSQHASGDRAELPAIFLRQPDGRWRPYRAGEAMPPTRPAAGDASGPLERATGQPPGPSAEPLPLQQPPEQNPPEQGPPEQGPPEQGPPGADPEPSGLPAVREPEHPGGETQGDAGAGAWARLAGSAFDPGRRGLRALAVVAVLVVLGAGVLAWWSGPRPEPVVPQLSATAVASPRPSGPVVLVVAVTGEVHEPGLVELPPGARVADAVEAAGGLLPEAEIDHLNLARPVSDGELIAVGIDSPPEPVPGAGGDPAPGALVNLNTATPAELQTLPGIGPALAQRIIDYRTEQGPFTSVSQLRQVAGIGEVRFAELRELVTV